jgi:hypothetical protein
VEINCACLDWLDVQEDMVFSCTPHTSPFLVTDMAQAA